MEGSVQASQTGGASKPKPVLTPKPRLAPKPFSLQKTTAIRSIHAPKTVPAVPKSRPDQTGKSEAAGVPKLTVTSPAQKPPQPASASDPKPGSVSVSTKPQPKTTNTSEAGLHDEGTQKSDPVPQSTPSKETPKSEPIQKDEVVKTNHEESLRTVTKPASTSDPKPSSLSVPTKPQPKTTKAGLREEGPQKSDPVTQTTPPKQTPKPESIQKDDAVQTNHKASADIVTKSEQGDLERKEETQTSVVKKLEDSGSDGSSAASPAYEWGGTRKRLSMELTSKFESGGLSLPLQPAKATSMTSTKDESKKPEPEPSQATPEPSNRESDEGGPSEEYHGGGSIKRRISLLFDSSSRPEVMTKREEPEAINGTGGVKARIKNWATESSCEAPKTEKKPQVAPRTRSKSSEPAAAPTAEKTLQIPTVEPPAAETSPSQPVDLILKASPAEPATETPLETPKDTPSEDKSVESATETPGEQNKLIEGDVQPQNTANHEVDSATSESGEHTLKRDNVKRRSVRFGIVERDDGGPPLILGSASESSSEEEEEAREEETDEDIPVSVPVYKRVGILQRKDDEIQKEEEERLKHLEFEKRRRAEEHEQATLQLEEEQKREKERQREEEKLREALRQEEMERRRKEEWERERLEEEEREKKRMREEEMERERQMEIILQRQREEEREKAKQEDERLKHEQEEREKERLKEAERKEERLREERERQRLREEDERRIHQQEEHRLERKLIEEEINMEKQREEEWEKEWVKKTEGLRGEEGDKEREGERQEEAREKERLREEAEERERRRRLEEEERMRERLRQEEEERKRREVERRMQREQEEEMERMRQMEKQKEEERERERQKEEREKERLREEAEERERRRRLEEEERMRERLRQEEEERMRQMEKQREEERREEERKRQIEKERVEELERKMREELERKQADELKEKLRKEEERRREELELTSREHELAGDKEEQSLISFDDDLAQKSEAPYSPLTKLQDPSESLIDVVYDDFSVKKPQIDVDFDDFSVKPRKRAVQTKPETTTYSWAVDLVDKEEEEEEEEQLLVPLDVTSQEYNTSEQMDKPESPEPTPAQEEAEEEGVEKPEEEELFPVEVEEEEKKMEKEEGEDEQEAQVNSYPTNDDDKDTDALISSEPDQQDGVCEPTYETESPKLVPDQVPEFSSEDVDTTDLDKEPELAPFPESSTPLLDTSAQRSRADLGKRRIRSRPSRLVRTGVAPTEGLDWRAHDSTDPKEATLKQKESDSEEDQPPTKTVSLLPPASHRVPMFPGLSPAALLPGRKKRTSEGETLPYEEKAREEKEFLNEEATPSPQQLSRSPRSASFLAGAARVLPPMGGKDGGTVSSPAWLKELKSKKRMSQHEGDS